jgi:hypothetical protein
MSPWQWLNHCSGCVSAWRSPRVLRAELQLANSLAAKTPNIAGVRPMRKPPAFMIAIGLPHGERDEDQLDRQQDDDGSPAAQATVGSIMHRLQRGGPSGIRDLRRFAAALEDLADAFMDKDRQGVDEAASEARDALNDIIQE